MADQTKMEDQKGLAEKRKEDEDMKKAEEESLRTLQEELAMGKELGGGPSGVSRTTSVSSLSGSEVEGRKRAREEKEGSEKMKKKKVDPEDELVMEEFGQDVLQNVDSGLDLIVKWLRQPTIQKMVTKPQQKKLERIVERVRAEVIRGKEDRIREEIREEERGAVTEVVRKVIREELGKKKLEQPTPVETTSYASALGKRSVPKVTGVRGPVQPAPKVVFVRHEKKESAEVIATLKRLVKPSELGLKVKRLTSIKNGAIVETENEDGAEILMKQKALTDAGLKVGKPVRKKPVVMVYDVGSDLKDEEVRREVFTRNMEGSDIKEEELGDEFVVRHRYKDARSSGKKCHLVVECSVRVRNWLRGRERVFIEWQSCRVKDYVDVARCYKCQKFGHVAKHCGSEKPGCSYCAGEHEYKECPDKGKRDKVRCANCVRDGRANVNHDAGWRGCPSYERAVKRNSDRIDYGL